MFYMRFVLQCMIFLYRISWRTRTVAADAAMVAGAVAVTLALPHSCLQKAVNIPHLCTVWQQKTVALLS
jgi:hypothetical protein